MKEQIDILMATYNGEKYLKEQIESILNQTYKNIRLVISDDCSKDRTKEILKQYENDNRIEVALLDGSVAFCYPSTTDQEMKCILSPGEQVYYNRTTHNLEKKNFILSDYSSWKDGKYYFKNETLENIAKQLERNFDVNIIIKNDSLKQIPYHMAFVNNETLDDILSAMNLDGYLTIKRDGKIIEIY